jgi:cytochrome P450
MSDDNALVPTFSGWLDQADPEVVMTSIDEVARELPLRLDGDPLTPRLIPAEIVGTGAQLRRFRYPNGTTGWITTTAEAFKAAMSETRLHARWFNGAPQVTPLNVEVPDMPGFIPSMNGAEHQRVRRLASGDFAVKRIESLRPYIEEVVAHQLDVLAALDPPVDLIANYCLPIPSQVIGRILGVPSEYFGDFQRVANATIGGRDEGDDYPTASYAAIGRLHEIIGEVIETKRREPGDDLITRLTTAGDPPLHDDEIKGLCTNLLIAGHDTTAANTAMAVVYLWDQPDQLAEFLAHPERVPDSVEELVRFNNLISDGAQIPRIATTDLELVGQHIAAGEWVMPSVMTANLDPAICPAGGGDHLDVTRSPGAHLSFGYGPHTCLGQHLARAELQIMLTRLFERFPTLRLAVDASQLNWNADAFIYRMSSLPVTW